MDGPRECHTEWSKSEREKQILYINAYMWNLEKWWNYPICKVEMETDIQNKCMNTKEECGGGEVWDKLGDWDWHIYTIDAIYV